MPLGRISTRRRPGTALCMERTGSRGEIEAPENNDVEKKKKNYA